MNVLEANRVSTGYRLESQLSQLALHATDRDPNRKLAWVNSVCLLFLVVGVVGSKPASMRIRPLPPIEEVSAVLVEPITPSAPPSQEQPSQENSDDEKPDTPQVVVVTPEAPSITFAVPTIGNLLVPNALAKAPPIVPLKTVALLPVRTPLPTVLNSTGSGGERPQPPYPKIALEQGQQGAVLLRMTVDEAGLIASIEVKTSSGFTVLDRSALDFVKRHWVVPPGTGTRIYEAAINYKLTRE